MSTCLEAPPNLVEQPPESDIEKSKRKDKELLIASREFAAEHIGRSWWHLATTLLSLVAFGWVACGTESWWLRSLGSLMMGLTIVRMFILYHDYEHSAIFKNSFLGGFILRLYGCLVLTPPSVWKRSHDHHHQNNSKLLGSSIGSFPIMTTSDYEQASTLERLEYRVARNPLVIVFGYFTVFLFGMCLVPLMGRSRKHLDAVLSLFVHFGFIAFLWWMGGWQTAFFAFGLPMWVATVAGAYLFYVQHNFPGARIRRGSEWSYTRAALYSSSYLEMGKTMNWLTGNIGYHHVHHLNSKIPFYRLPETMAFLEELQNPVTITLRFKDILGCLRLKLWDESQDRFVSFAEAKTNLANG